MRSETKALPGGEITYSIWMWSTEPASSITATVSSIGAASGPPRFTLCPAAHNQTCSIGELSAEQAIKVLVTDKIGAKATANELVTLNVTVQGAGLSPAEASITAAVGMVSSSPSPPPPPVTSPPFPLVMPGPTVNPSSLNTLFPVVTPVPNPTATPLRHGRVTAATSTASTLPLDSRLIGGQLAGLAILAVAVTLVVARLSLRPATPGAPAAPPAPAPSGEADPTADFPADKN